MRLSNFSPPQYKSSKALKTVVFEAFAFNFTHINHSTSLF
jgi:hypothetical protein